MAILIKGMEMPKNCGGCFLRVGQCSRRIYMENRPSDCPLVEVPEPHGRLIDADAVFDNLERTGWYDNADRDIAEDLVLDAPTVIPASEEAE